jgi:predicted ATPase/DNA-binding CsgD family transcriptional regulator
MEGSGRAGRASRAPLTSFVGRDLHIAQVRAALSQDRLVSLLGVGGVGKTRLAMAVAEDHARRFADEVVSVDFEAVSDPTYVGQAVHDAVAPHANQQASLVDTLADRTMLLVMDGCEHLGSRLGDLVADLLTRCPDLRVLATSRIPLGVDGERLIHVPPLSLERAGDEKLSPAARLFQTRARAVVGPLEPDEHEAVEELCRRLDGLPLAIELAATRTRTMTVSEMLEGINDWVAVLRPSSVASESPSESPSESRSLEAVLRWSWDHCTAVEQQLWSQLSVFAGPITLSAAAAVCGFGDRFEITDAVDGLIQRSLLIRETRHKITTFRMLDTIATFGRRAFADSGGLPSALTYAQLRDRHARHYAELAHQLSVDWLGPNQRQLSRQTSLVIANFRAAFDHLMQFPDGAAASDMYADLWPYWIGCGRLRESQTWMQRLSDRRAAPHARALCISGWTEFVLSDIEAAARQLTAGLAVGRAARRAGAPRDPRTENLSRSLLSACHATAGDFDVAKNEYERSIAEVESLGDDLIAALLWENYAELAVIAGDLDRGRLGCVQAKRICRAHREQWVLSWTLWVEALAAYLDGDLEETVARALEAWDLKATLDDLLGAAVVAEVAAWAYAMRGDTVLAAEIFGATGQYWAGTDGPLLGFRELLLHRERCIRRIESSLSAGERASAEERGIEAGLLGLVDRVREVADELPTAHGRRLEALPRPTAELLTPREREIVDYVRQGLTNKEIAERLTVSVRTVEAHVSRVLAKLGVGRRSGIATALSAAGTP